MTKPLSILDAGERVPSRDEHGKSSPEYQRIWRLKNPSKTAEYCRRHRAKNLEARRLTDREQQKKRRFIHGEAIRAQNRKRRAINPEKHREGCRKWYYASPENKDKVVAGNRKWRAANRERSRGHIRNYYRKNRGKWPIEFRIKRALRSRVREAVKHGSKSATTQQLLGCTVPSLRIYLESKFETGMSWSNYGSRWEIDHIMPCAIFDLTKASHQRRCFHFSNLQPLFREDNQKKRASIPEGGQYRLI